MTLFLTTRLIILIALLLFLSSTFVNGAAPKPTAAPTRAPTRSPTFAPSAKPTTAKPSAKPSASPTAKPTTAKPSARPSAAPTAKPTTAQPSARPTRSPTAFPTVKPSPSPTVSPTPDPAIVSGSSKPSSKKIAGTVIGILAFVAFAIVLYAYCRHLQKRDPVNLNFDKIDQEDPKISSADTASLRANDEVGIAMTSSGRYSSPNL